MSDSIARAVGLANKNVAMLSLSYNKLNVNSIWGGRLCFIWKLTHSDHNFYSILMGGRGSKGRGGKGEKNEILITLI